MMAELFVGREQELARLRATFDAACRGDGGVVMLSGEPGIGKTRVARELEHHARANGAQVFWGRAQEFPGTPPYWPWIQASRAYRELTPEDLRRREEAPFASELQRLFPSMGAGLPGLANPTAPESGEAQFRLFDAMGGLLRTVAARAPVLLVLDDLHWADPPSLLMLLHVAQQLTGARLLLVGAYRSIELDRSHPLSPVLAELGRSPFLERVTLGGLSEDHVGEYMRATLGREPPVSLVTRIHSRTDGNPFFMTEVVRLLADGGAGHAAAGGPSRAAGWLPTLPGDESDALIIPEGVREALGRRFGGLASDTHALLTVAAVVGREFDYRLLSALSDADGDRLLDQVEEALAAGIIEETGTPGAFRFAHALMRDALLAGLSSVRRAQLHGRVAESLERLAGPSTVSLSSELAVHFDESTVVNPQHARQAARYARLAAEQARARLAWDDAAEHYTRCLKHLAAADFTQPHEAELWLELGLCRLANARDPLEGFRQAFGLWPLGEPFGLARSLLRVFKLSSALWMVRRFMPAVDRALAAIGSSVHPDVCALLAWKAMALRGPDGDDAAARAHQMALELGLDDDHYPLVLRTRPARVALDEGRLEDAVAMLHQLRDDHAPAALGELPDVLLAHAEWASGHIDRAEDPVRRLAAHFDHLRRPRNRQFWEGWLAFITWRRGDNEAAESLLGEVPDDQWNLAVKLLRPEMALVAGDPEGALALLPEDTTWWPMTRAQLLAARCRALAAMGDEDAARAVFREWETAFGDLYAFSLPEYLYALSPLDDVFATFADAPLLIRVRDRLRQLHEVRNWWCGSGPDYFRGTLELRLGDLAAAEQCFQAGLLWAEREQIPLVAGRCRTGLATIAEQRGDPETAATHLEAAIECFRIADASLYLDAALQALAGLGRSRTSRIRHPLGLTEREVEVLALIAGALSNAEIAAQLVLSDRTVERHVANIYQKLDIRGRAARAQAVSLAFERGLVDPLHAGSDT